MAEKFNRFMEARVPIRFSTSPAASVTFIIPARNEAGHIAVAVKMAIAATRAGDRVVVVDSASTDNTAEEARTAGADVLNGPKGKGAAMAVGIAESQTTWLIFLDGDLLREEPNVAEVLRQAVDREHENKNVGQVLGEFTEAKFGVIHSRLIGVYEPLINSLFLEMSGQFGNFPLTGFRAVRLNALPNDLTQGYGVEAAINIHNRRRSITEPVGMIALGGNPNPQMGGEIIKTILDIAEQYHRIRPTDRGLWESWINKVSELKPQQGANDNSYRQQVTEYILNHPSPSITNPETTVPEL
ncbi:MAG: glycosyltransferase family 2 protein [Candidatus Dormibacteraceae bacterium]